MPKAEPHFDAGALLAAVQEQDVGLDITTNNEKGLRRILYAHMRANPSLRCYIYAVPNFPLRFFLVKSAIANRAPAEEPADE